MQGLGSPVEDHLSLHHRDGSFSESQGSITGSWWQPASWPQSEALGVWNAVLLKAEPTVAPVDSEPTLVRFPAPSLTDRITGLSQQPPHAPRNIESGPLSSAAADQDDDEAPATVYTNAILPIGTSHSGAIQFAGDHDWFRVFLQAGRTYRFDLAGDTLKDPRLCLRDSGGDMVAGNDNRNSWSLDSRLTVSVFESDVYFIDVYASSVGLGSYRMQALDIDPIDDLTPVPAAADALAAHPSAPAGGQSNLARNSFRTGLEAWRSSRFDLDRNPLLDPTLQQRSAQDDQLSFPHDASSSIAQIRSLASRFKTGSAQVADADRTEGHRSIRGSAREPAETLGADVGTAGALAVGSSSRGVVKDRGDRTRYRVALRAGVRYRFSLDGISLRDPTLWLRTPSGSLLAANRALRDDPAKISFIATRSGTYLLEAGDAGRDTGSYRITATKRGAPATLADDYDTGSFSTAVLAVGGSRTGGIQFDGDRDGFLVNLIAGNTYQFNLNGSSLSNPYLALLDAKGVQQASNDDRSISDVNAQITFEASTTGTYYLDARSLLLGTGSYVITSRLVSRSPFIADDLAADPSTSAFLAIGGSRSGVVNRGDDRDWFRVSLTAGTSYQIRLSGNDLRDPDLYCRDARGMNLVYNDDTFGLDSQIIFTPTSSGDYYFDVGSPFRSNVGSYTLSLRAITRQGNNDSPDSDGYRDSPIYYSADKSNAVPIELGREMDALIEFVGDRDWYRVSLVSGRTYQFTLEGKTLADPRLRLHDGSGADVLISSEDFDGDRFAQITYTANRTDTYYLDAGASGSLTGGYRLSATEIRQADRDQITGLQNAKIRAVVDQALGDNLFSHQELESLLRRAGAGGVSAVELADLRLIGDHFTSYLDSSVRGYLQYIYRAVVDGNPANRWWTGGGSTRVALGDLSAGSSESQVDLLVDKWFAGLDLPANSIRGDLAAGASGLRFDYGRMTGELFVGDIDFDDIRQGRAGTCYFMAALASLAANQKQAIREMFYDNGDGTYGVRFYGSSGDELWVTVNSAVPVNAKTMVLSGNEQLSLAGEMWVALAEKAYAQAHEIGLFNRRDNANAYTAIEGGMQEALNYITSRPTVSYSAYRSTTTWMTADQSLSHWNDALPAAIAAARAGRSLLVISFENSEDKNGNLHFIDGHAYAITGYNPTTEQFIVANPWGRPASGYAPVFEADWRTMFAVRAVVAWV